jgi:hypothetical protein
MFLLGFSSFLKRLSAIIRLYPPVLKENVLLFPQGMRIDLMSRFDVGAGVHRFSQHTRFYLVASSESADLLFPAYLTA